MQKNEQDLGKLLQV